jgi:hypothetical protein
MFAFIATLHLWFMLNGSELFRFHEAVSHLRSHRRDGGGRGGSRRRRQQGLLPGVRPTTLQHLQGKMKPLISKEELKD